MPAEDVLVGAGGSLGRSGPAGVRGVRLGIVLRASRRVERAAIWATPQAFQFMSAKAQQSEDIMQYTAGAIRRLVSFGISIALAQSVSAQDFLVEYVDNRPDGQISVNLDSGIWVDHSESGRSGEVEVDGEDLVLKEEGEVIAVIKGGLGAEPTDAGTVELDEASIGTWTCVEF